MTSNPSSFLNSYQFSIEQKIREEILEMGEKNPLRDGCEYVLLSGGKRYRPIVTMMLAKALGFGFDVSCAALTTEFFHTASLVADDLPCMDDDDERRNKPSLHKVYGESMALLVSYALIASGYGLLSKNSELLKKSGLAQQSCDRLCVLALENATYNTGVFGATGGQFLDVFRKDNSLTALQEVIQKKTVSLFEIAFVLGWLYGGGAVDRLPEVKKAAFHFGMAFQIVDDIHDREQDLNKENQVNLSILFGEEATREMFNKELNQLQQTFDSLKIDPSEFILLLRFLLKS
jgi:geranylgeranyl diphosphate synthase type II